MLDNLSNIFEMIKANADAQKAEIAQLQADIKTKEEEIISTLEQMELIKTMLNQLKNSLQDLTNEYNEIVDNINNKRLAKFIEFDEEVKSKAKELNKKNEKKLNQLVEQRNQLVEELAPLKKRMEDLSIKSITKGQKKELTPEEQEERDCLFRQIQDKRKAIDELDERISALERK